MNNPDRLNPREAFNCSAIKPLGIKNGLVVNSSFDGQLSFTVTPNKFYAIPKEMIHLRMKQEAQMIMYFKGTKGERRFKNLPFDASKLTRIGVEAMIGSFFAVNLEENWYRVRVIYPSDENQARVFCIDYGFEESVKWESLFVLPEKFLKLSAAVVQCSISDLREPKKGWTKEDIIYFENFLESSCPIEGSDVNLEGAYLKFHIKDLGRSKSTDFIIPQASEEWNSLLYVSVTNPEDPDQTSVTQVMVEEGHGESDSVVVRSKERDPIVDLMPLRSVLGVMRPPVTESRSLATFVDNIEKEEYQISTIPAYPRPFPVRPRKLAMKNDEKSPDKIEQADCLVEGPCKWILTHGYEKQESEDFPEDDTDLDRFVKASDTLEALLGYKEREIGQRCRFYGTVRGCRDGRYCRFKHIDREVIPIGTTKDEVCFDVSDPGPLKIGSEYVICINKYISGSRYSISFPVGVIPLEDLDPQELQKLQSSEKTADDMKYLDQSKELKNTYSVLPTEKLDSFPAKGQLVAVKVLEHFFRGRVIDVYAHYNVVRVSFVDFSYMTMKDVERKDIWSLFPEFTLMPPRTSVAHILSGSKEVPSENIEYFVFIVKCVNNGDNDGEPIFKIKTINKKCEKKQTEEKTETDDWLKK
jgi:hypothetical protein